MDVETLKTFVNSFIVGWLFLVPAVALKYRWPVWLVFLLGLALPFLHVVPHGLAGEGWWPRSGIAVGVLLFFGFFVGAGTALATWLKRTGQVA